MSSFVDIENEFKDIQEKLADLNAASVRLSKKLDTFKYVSMDSRIEYLRSKGLSYNKIAEAVGLSTMAVYNRIKKMEKNNEDS